MKKISSFFVNYLSRLVIGSMLSRALVVWLGLGSRIHATVDHLLVLVHVLLLRGGHLHVGHEKGVLAAKHRSHVLRLLTRWLLHLGRHLLLLLHRVKHERRHLRLTSHLVFAII